MLIKIEKSNWITYILAEWAKENRGMVTPSYLEKMAQKTDEEVRGLLEADRQGRISRKTSQIAQTEAILVRLNDELTQLQGES